MTSRNDPCYLVGIGAQKSGTSWLHAALSTHSGIEAAPAKEVDFFSYHHDRGYHWYASHWAGGNVRLDVSPSYLHDPRAPARLKAFAPDARIIVCLRDPVDRAFSNHLHEVARGHIPAMPFARALPSNPDYIAQGLYGQHLARWVEVFGRDRILPLFFETMTGNPLATLAQVYRFADLAPPRTPPTLPAAQNRSDRARLPLLRAVLRAGGTCLRQLRMEPVVEAAKALPVLRHIRSWNEVHLSSVVPPLTPPERQGLAAHFSDDLRLLSQVLGQEDLPWESWRALSGRAVSPTQTSPSATNRAAAARPAMRFPSGSGCVPSPDM